MTQDATTNINLAIEYLSTLYDIDRNDQSEIDRYVDNLHILLARALEEKSHDSFS